MKLPKQTTSVVHVPIPFARGEIGLGDAISRATSAVGISPCQPCKQRAARLNRHVVLTGWGPSSHNHGTS